MESIGGGGGSIPRPATASSRRLGRSTSSASRAGAGAFAYDGMRTAPLFSSANFARSLRKAASFGHKKASAGDVDAAAPPPRRALSSKDQNTVHAAEAGAAMLSPRRSLSEPGVAARQVPWEPARRRRSTGATSPEEASGRGSSAGAPRETTARKTKEGPEKEEAVHRARVLSAQLLQWRFANARLEMAVARTTSAAENKLFYTWLRVAELRNIQAAKRIVAQRRRQKLKLARLLRPHLPLLASWEPLDKPNADAVSDLARVLSAACTSLPVTAGAQADVESLQETLFACVGKVTEIEANADMFYATAGATSDTLGELARTIRQEVDGLEEAIRLSRIVTRLQRMFDHDPPDPAGAIQATATPAAAGATRASPSSASRPPTFSPSPCPFAWGDCVDVVDSVVLEVPVSRPDLEEVELAPARMAPSPANVSTRRGSTPPSTCSFLWAVCAGGEDGVEEILVVPDLLLASSAGDAELGGGAVLLGELARAAPPPPVGSPPCFVPRFRRAILEDPEARGEMPPPPAGSPPVGRPRRIQSKVGAVGGSLLAPAGASPVLRLQAEERRDKRRSARARQDATGWSTVRPAHWWRRDSGRTAHVPAARGVPSAFGARCSRPAARDGAIRAKRALLLVKMRGRCFRCLSHRHFAIDCQELKVCWKCHKPGHLAGGCREPPASPPTAKPPRARATYASPLRSFRDALMAPAELACSLEVDVCCSEAKEVVLACRRGYKEGVDSALSEENLRDGRMPLLLQGEDEGREAREQVSATESEEVLAWQGLIGEITAWDSCPASGCSPLPVVRVEQPFLVSPGDTSCEVVLEEVEIEEKRFAEPGAGSDLLSAQGEFVVEKEDTHQIEKDIEKGAGQKFEMDTASPVRTGPGQQDVEVGAPLCPLSSFLAQITVPLAATILGTPAMPLAPEMEVEAPSVWKSGRLAKLHPNGVNIEQLAKETVARRLGSLPEAAHPSGRRREDFLALLDVSDRPFSDQAVAAIDDLVLAVKKTKKKKTTSGTRMERQMPPGVAR